MPHIQVDHPQDSHLRILFDDMVLTFNLAADATFEDVARALRDLSGQRDRGPIAIDVILPSKAACGAA